ncbi:MAG: hypothetical protein OXF06_04400 [Bacteroidetes bacterium]|nr:hypothetical protein [Bacteroidota bacterium]
MDKTSRDHDPKKTDIREAFNDGVAQIERHIGELRNELSNVVPPVKDFIVKHPVGTITTVLGIGFMIGCFIGNSRRDDQ